MVDKVKRRMEDLKSTLTEDEFKAFVSGDRLTVKTLLKNKNVPVMRTEETHLETHGNEDLENNGVPAAN
jgi:hypothetical protein